MPRGRCKIVQKAKWKVINNSTLSYPKALCSGVFLVSRPCAGGWFLHIVLYYRCGVIPPVCGWMVPHDGTFTLDEDNPARVRVDGSKSLSTSASPVASRPCAGGWFFDALRQDIKTTIPPVCGWMVPIKLRPFYGMYDPARVRVDGSVWKNMKKKFGQSRPCAGGWFCIIDIRRA